MDAVCSQPKCNNPPVPGRKLCAGCATIFKERARKRRTGGKCSSCGSFAVEGHSQCEQCATEAAETRHAKRVAGRCWSCSEPATPGQSWCSPCAEKSRAATAGKRESGKCTKCGSFELVLGGARCAPCTERERNLQLIYNYGKGSEWFDSLLLAQSGKCGVCGTTGGT